MISWSGLPIFLNLMVSGQAWWQTSAGPGGTGVGLGVGEAVGLGVGVGVGFGVGVGVGVGVSFGAAAGFGVGVGFAATGSADRKNGTTSAAAQMRTRSGGSSEAS